jgi:cytoskeletal protein RodZ
LRDETFGDRLAETRRNAGLSIDQVSDILRIRPSIIESLEAGDFNHMPLKGYSRNMVSSYARFLGLSSTELTEQFLREYREFERLASRTHNNANANVYDSGSHGNSASLRQPGMDGAATGPGRSTVSSMNRGKASKSYWTTENPESLNRNLDRNGRGQGNGRVSPSRLAAGGSRPIRNQQYASRRTSASLPLRFVRAVTGRPILLIALLIILLIAVLIAAALLANSCSKAADTETMPVTGASLTTGEDGVDESVMDQASQGDQASAGQDARYQPFTLRVEVTEGQSWLLITVNGTQEAADVFSAPWSKTFENVSSVSLESGAPSCVKIYRNDEEIQMDLANGIGFLELEIEQRPGTTSGTGTAEGDTVPNANDSAGSDTGAGTGTGAANS